MERETEINVCVGGCGFLCSLRACHTALTERLEAGMPETSTLTFLTNGACVEGLPFLPLILSTSLSYGTIRARMVAMAINNCYFLKKLMKYRLSL